MSKVTKFESEKQLIDYLASYISSNINNSKHFNLAISGGSTPLKLFKQMSNENSINYSKTTILQVDERYTPAIDKLSNQFQAIECFGSEGFEEVFEEFDVKLSYEDCIRIYNQKISNLNKTPNSNLFNLTLLGFGLDGHFASIFPKTPNDKNWEMQFETNQYVIGTTASEIYPIPKRMTLTPKAIQSSDKIIAVLIGQNKKSILEEFQNGILEQQKFPANYWRDKNNFEILAFVD
jgi:6-phosphogluconolactonase